MAKKKKTRTSLFQEVVAETENTTGGEMIRQVESAIMRCVSSGLPGQVQFELESDRRFVIIITELK